MSTEPDIFRSAPLIIEPLTVMSKPNELIEVHNKPFILKSTENEYEVDGKLVFHWFPEIGLRFRGKIKADGNFIKEYISNTIYQIIIDGNNIGEGWVTGINENGSEEYSISGITPKVIVMGEPSIAVEKVHFEIVNLNEFHGDIVKTNSSSGSRNRITLEDDKYTIIIDKRKEYKELKEQLRDEGGIVALYACNLLRKKGAITYKEARSITKCLYFFLTFINGRRVSPVFLKGVVEERVIWEEYFHYKSSTYKYVESWPVSFDTKGFSNLWRKFLEVWRNENEQDCLITAVHWYIEANNGAGAIDGSIVMVQSALELLYNWVVVERKKMLKGDDSKNISASNKIGLLLSTIGLQANDIPQGLKNLKSYAHSKGLNAPEVLVEIRNAIIHSHQDKRDKLKEIPRKVISETLDIGIWYVERVLLNLLEYKGEYFNRCNKKNEYLGEKV